MTHFYAKARYLDPVIEEYVLAVEGDKDPDVETDRVYERLDERAKGSLGDGEIEGLHLIGTSIERTGDYHHREIKRISEEKAQQLKSEDQVEITVSADLSDVSRNQEEIEGIIREALEEALWNTKEQFPGIAEVPISVE